MTLAAVRRLPLLALAALTIFAAPAQAGPLVASAPDCADAALERPFLPWLDQAHYVLAPDGTFESGAAGWTVSGGATAAENEPFFVHGVGESTSLGLAAGGSATSPATCVGVEHPTLRFFARRTGGDATATLSVEVLFEDAAGQVRSASIGAVASAGAWEPSAPMPIVANLLPLLPGDHTPVAFRFTATGGGSWLVDDVYVDPYCRC